MQQKSNKEHTLLQLQKILDNLATMPTMLSKGEIGSILNQADANTHIPTINQQRTSEILEEEGCITICNTGKNTKMWIRTIKGVALLNYIKNS